MQNELVSTGYKDLSGCGCGSGGVQDTSQKQCRLQLSELIVTQT